MTFDEYEALDEELGMFEADVFWAACLLTHVNPENIVFSKCEMKLTNSDEVTVTLCVNNALDNSTHTEIKYLKRPDIENLLMGNKIDELKSKSAEVPSKLSIDEQYDIAYKEYENSCLSEQQIEKELKQAQKLSDRALGELNYLAGKHFKEQLHEWIGDAKAIIISGRSKKDELPPANEPYMYGCLIVSGQIPDMPDFVSAGEVFFRPDHHGVIVVDNGYIPFCSRNGEYTTRISNAHFIHDKHQNVRDVLYTACNDIETLHKVFKYGYDSFIKKFMDEVNRWKHSVSGKTDLRINKINEPSYTCYNIISAGEVYSELHIVIFNDDTDVTVCYATAYIDMVERYKKFIEIRQADKTIDEYRQELKECCQRMEPTTMKEINSIIQLAMGKSENTYQCNLSEADKWFNSL